MWRLSFLLILILLVSVEAQEAPLPTVLSYPDPLIRVLVARSDKTEPGKFRGRLRIVTLKDGGKGVVNEVSLEDYLTSVVARELMSDQPEAMKAQAVVARTYAVARLKPEKPYDLESTSKNQAYHGISAEHPRARRAVQATLGQVIVHRGRLAREVVYHSTCGAKTANNEEVFRGAPVAYLRTAKCGFCVDSPHRRWGGSFSLAEIGQDLGSWLRKNVPSFSSVGADESLEFKQLESPMKGPSGRVSSLTLRWNGGRVAVPGSVLRRHLRFRDVKGVRRVLPSTRFALRQAGGSGLYRIEGEGWGHGVGMCQWGAIGMARAGVKYPEIIEHYYRDTELRLWPLE